MMTGGGSLLHGLDKALEEETGITIKRAEDPLSCVAIGTGQVLEEMELMSLIDSTISAK